MSETKHPDIDVDGTTYVPLSEVSELLDEVFRLRRALAYEALVVEAQTLDVKALGKSRRYELSASIERMQLAVLGDAELAYAGEMSSSLRYACRTLRTKEALTRWNWRNWREEADESGRKGHVSD